MKHGRTMAVKATAMAVLVASSLATLTGPAAPIASAVQAGQPNSPSTPPIVPDTRMKNLGVVDPRGVFEAVFTLTNRSTQPVKIRNFRVACNCTRMIPDSMTIPPRGQTNLKMTVDLRGDTGRMQKTALIFFEGYDRPIEVGVTGQMQYELEAPQAPLRVRSPQVTAQLRSSTGRPVRLLSVHGEAPNLLSQVPDSGERVLMANVRKNFNTGAEVPAALLVATDSEDTPLVAVRIISADVSRREMPFIRMNSDLNFSHKFFNMGMLKKGEAQTYTTTVFRDDHGRAAWSAGSGRGA